MKRTTILYIAQSIDGFIASADGDISWLSIVEADGEDYGYYEFMKTIDTVIIGRKSFEKVMSFGLGNPYPGKKCYVVSASQDKKIHDEYENIEYVKSVETAYDDISNTEGLNIYVDGGSTLLNSMMRKGLIDEIIISTIPIILGSGIRLFENPGKRRYLKLIDTKGFESGLVQTRYEMV